MICNPLRQPIQVFWPKATTLDKNISFHAVGFAKPPLGSPANLPSTRGCTGLRQSDRQRLEIRVQRTLSNTFPIGPSPSRSKAFGNCSKGQTLSTNGRARV